MQNQTSRLQETNTYFWLPLKKCKTKIPVENIIRLKITKN